MNDSMVPSYAAGPLPPGAEAYLRPDNPLLLSLRARYAALMPIGHSTWAPAVLERDLDLRYFRGDNVYNWQVRGGVSAAIYARMAQHARRIDRLGLWDRLSEDALFGAYTFPYEHDRCISRDLLDSIIQINFLDRHVGLSRSSGATLLDIGAGYGRLAWRLSQSGLGLARIWCVDAIAESTFLCAYYLGFRGAGERVSVLALDQAEQIIGTGPIDVAVAIHSLSEAPLRAIEWWLDLLERSKPVYLLIVPNTPDQLINMEQDGSRHDFQPLIERYGYHLAVKEDMFDSAPDLQRESGYMGTQLWLFARGR